LTVDGQLIIASATGSQLPAYAYGADHVIWVVGAQKIVADHAAGMARLHDYVLPLESKRAKAAYGVPGSNISQVLTINTDFSKRMHVIIVEEALGY
jgi:hypothetical protein